MTEEPKEYGIRRATLALALGALGSRGVGFFREVVVAAKFGTGRAFDLYVAASAFPIFLSSIFLYALPDFLIPYFANLKENRPAALRQFLLWTFLGGMVFLGALYFSANLWVKLFAPGLSSSEISFGVRAFQILLLFVFGTGMEAILRSYYQVEGRFTLTAASPLLTGLVVLGSVFFLTGKFSVYALAWGWAIGSLVPVALMLTVLFFYSPGVSSTPAAKSADGAPATGEWKGFSYVFVIAVLGQLMVLSDRFFGSFLPPESLSAYYYAYLPLLFPIGILIYPLGYSIFPKISNTLASGDNQETKRLLHKAFFWAILLTVPFSFFCLLESGGVVSILFQRGAFNQNSTSLTSLALKWESLGLLGNSFSLLLLRVYFGAGRLKELAMLTFFALFFKILVTPFLMGYLGLRGLALSYFLTQSLYFILLAVKLGESFKLEYWLGMFKSFVSIGVIFLVSWFLSFQIIPSIFKSDFWAAPTGFIAASSTVALVFGLGVFLSRRLFTSEGYSLPMNLRRK